MKMWLAEIIFSVIMIALSVVFFIMAGDIGGAINPRDVGPAAFPRLTLAIVCLCAGAQILISLRQRARLIAQNEEGKKLTFHNKNNMLAAFAVIMVYGYIMPIIGFFQTTPVVILAMMFLMGNRKWLQMLLVTAGFTAFTYVIFVMILRVSLP